MDKSESSKKTEAKVTAKNDKAAKTASKKQPVSSGYSQKQDKKTEARKILRGQAHIQSTYNNTIVNLTDLSGNSLAWGSAGRLGFKGAKKATPYAATLVVDNISERVQKYGLKEVDVYLNGIGAGREAAVRALQSNGIQVMSIKDVTPIPHNGCRPKKARRV
jgi:small subunit ribosomal protein S11